MNFKMFYAYIKICIKQTIVRTLVKLFSLTVKDARLNKSMIAHSQSLIVKSFGIVYIRHKQQMKCQ